MGSWNICSLRVFCFALCCCCFFLVIEVIGFRCSSLSHFFPFDSVLKYKSSLKMAMHTKPQNIKLPKSKTYNKQNLTSRNWTEQKSVRYVSIYQYTTFIANQQQILLSPPPPLTLPLFLKIFFLDLSIFLVYIDILLMLWLKFSKYWGEI